MNKKILSKRQIQRRSKASLSKITNSIYKPECQYLINDSSSLITNDNNEVVALGNSHENIEVSDSITDIVPNNTDSTSVVTEYSGSILSKTSNLLFSVSQTSEEEIIDKNAILKNDLRYWAASENISSNSVTKLLKLLHPFLYFLPLDSRTLMKTPRITSTIKLNNGEMIYFGILNKISLKVQQGIKTGTNSITLQINIDGVPLFKSSGIEFYPILGLSKDLADDTPFAIAIFCGRGKPDPINVFLKDFIDEVNILKNQECTFIDRKFIITISCFICDAPARSYIKQSVGHTGKHGCEKCTIVGKYENKRINYAQDSFNSYALRKDSDFFSDRSDHIKGKSPLLDIGINMVTQIVLDPMHLIFLGVVKRLLLNYFIEGQKPHKFSQNMLSEINEKTNDFQSYIPSEFSRKPRSFKEIRRWKATEFRLFILYTGPVLLKNIMSNEKYNHFLLLHISVLILSDSSFIEQYFHVAKKCLEKFVVEASSIYGNDFVVYNVHNLTHLCNEVQAYGTINNFSCFPFENYLGSLKNRVRSKKFCLQRIHRRVKELESCSSLRNTNNIKISYPVPKNVFNENYDIHNKLVSFSCRRLEFRDYCLSTKRNNNCVLLKHKKVCIIKAIHCLDAQEIILEGVVFRFHYDFYIENINSSELCIFYVSNLHSKNSITFKVHDILCKCVRIPYKNGFVIFPLIHSH